MRCPDRSNFLFRDFITVADLYPYPTQDFDFPRRQLALGNDKRL